MRARRFHRAHPLSTKRCRKGTEVRSGKQWLLPSALTRGTRGPGPEPRMSEISVLVQKRLSLGHPAPFTPRALSGDLVIDAGGADVHQVTFSTFQSRRPNTWGPRHELRPVASAGQVGKTCTERDTPNPPSRNASGSRKLGESQPAAHPWAVILLSSFPL